MRCGAQRLSLRSIRQGVLRLLLGRSVRLVPGSNQTRNEGPESGAADRQRAGISARWIIATDASDDPVHHRNAVVEAERSPAESRDCGTARTSAGRAADQGE